MNSFSYAIMAGSPSPWCFVLVLYHGACCVATIQGVRERSTAARSASIHADCVVFSGRPLAKQLKLR